MEIWKETQLRKLAVESNVETAYRIALNFFNSMGYEYCAFSTTAHLAGQRFDSVNLNNYPTTGTPSMRKTTTVRSIQ